MGFSLGLLPIFQVCLAVMTFILSYVWSVARKDVTPTFPFISDTGANRPESCFFSQMLNISAFLSFFIMYIRYKYVQLKLDMVEEREKPRWLPRLNSVSRSLGVLAAFGVSLVANFQDNSDLHIVHFVGASLAFGLGVVYCILQTVISRRLEGNLVCHWRLAITVLCIAAGVIMAASWITADLLWSSGRHSGEKLWWKPEDPGYAAHICSTVFEWVLAIGFFLFFFTYVGEFNRIEAEVLFRPLLAEAEVERGDPGTNFSNGEPGSRLLQGVSSFCQQGNADPGERTSLLGARPYHNKNSM